MIPKYIEKFNFMIDIQSITIRPRTDLVKGIAALFTDNFNGFSQDTQIYRGGWTFSILWSVVKLCVPARTLTRVKVFDKGKETDMIKDFYDLDILEKKFGGNLPNKTTFWPPTPEPNFITANYIKKKNLELFYIFGKENDGQLYRSENGGAQNNSQQNNSQQNNSRLNQSTPNLIPMAQLVAVGDKKSKNQIQEKTQGWWASLISCCYRDKKKELVEQEVIQEVMTKKITKKKNIKVPQRSTETILTVSKGDISISMPSRVVNIKNNSKRNILSDLN